jgi:hypothetical protein
MKDYLEIYAKKATPKFQMGGEMPAEPGMEQGAAPQGGGDQLQAMLAEYAQTRDPQLAVAICDTLVEMMGAQGGGEAPAGEAPMMRRGGRFITKAPIFKKGGKLIA